MTYDPAAIAAHFDQLGPQEWERFDRTLGDRVSLELHSRVLARFIPRGSEVLEVGAGPGRFTEQLHALGCSITVGDISVEQLRLNEDTARRRGFASSIRGWSQLDICDLTHFADAAFDAVVAFGGPLSYVFDRREQALRECLRVLRPGGVLLLSVMSLWGTVHRHLGAVLALPEVANRSIIAPAISQRPATPPARIIATCSARASCECSSTGRVRSSFGSLRVARSLRAWI
jgi:SAM-dependent methyltransferase